MKMCRDNLSTILEKEGVLTEILTQTFATNSRTLFDDLMFSQGVGEKYEERIKKYVGSIEDFVGNIYSIYEAKYLKNDEQEVYTSKNPYELMAEVGYDLYECKSEEEIQSFKRYYEKDEALCTFLGGRLEECVVFFAVKKDIDDIKREDFPNPKRQDKYGTSVISIQFTKKGHSRLSIKNRYNHKVINPDATFENDLDQIIPGLNNSFARLLNERGIDFFGLKSNEKELDLETLLEAVYILADDGRYYKYNYEINGIYYCPGNIVIDKGNIIKLEPEKAELLSTLILDKQRKSLHLYDKKILGDAKFEIDEIERIEIKRNKEEPGARTIKIKEKKYGDNIIIDIDRENCIINYEYENLEKFKENCNMRIEEIYYCPGNIIIDNDIIVRLDPQKQELIDYFILDKEKNTISLYDENSNNNECFAELIGKIKKIKFESRYKNGKEIRKITILQHEEREPVVIEIDEENNIVGYKNSNITSIIGNFLRHNKKLRRLDVPNLTGIHSRCLNENMGTIIVNAPNLKEVTTVNVSPCIVKEFLNNIKNMNMQSQQGLQPKKSNTITIDAKKLDKSYYH